VLASTYQSTDSPLLSTLYEPLPKHLISVLDTQSLRSTWSGGGCVEGRGQPHKEKWPMSQFVPVAKVTELSPGQMKMVVADGERLLVVYL
jgi:hypothetical protein